MKKAPWIAFALALLLPLCLMAQSSQTNNKGWKAGVAKQVITPREPLWMAGFASRTEPAKGTLHDLWIKVLALEDAEGNQSVLVTSDLLGIPKDLSDRIRERLEAAHGLDKSQIILNSSHTHSAPVLSHSLSDIYPMEARHLEAVKKYSDELVEQIVMLVGESLERLEPADVFAQNGVARFQVNRRNNSAQHLERLTELSGPMDPAVPVLKVVNRSGDLMAVAFGYACHPTVLGDYEWSGDYPGFAQMELEKLYPGTTALFFQGAGADQNPLPRHTVPLAVQYGKTLAAAVERVLSEDMKQLEPRIKTAYAEVELPLTKAPTSSELTDYVNKSSGYQQQWAKRLLARLEAGEKFETSYPYPVQVWNLGDQPIFTLGGELVVEYAIELKRIFGQHAFVMGYSNDVMSYIPTTTILREGGYEGATAQMVYGLPSTWGSDSEIMILHKLVQLAKKAEVPQPEEKLF